MKVVPLDAEDQPKPQRLGFMTGEFKVPDDFNTMCADEIGQMFYGSQ